MKKKGNALLLIGIIGTGVFGAHFAIHYGRAMWGDRHIWWTPRSLALSLEETKSVFRMFLKGGLLQDHVARGALSVAKEKGGTEAVAPEDISVRLNNWQKVRGSFLHSAVYAAGMLGASITCLILGVVQAVRKK